MAESKSESEWRHATPERASERMEPPRKSAKRKTHKISERVPFDQVALLLQGGGALGAYQAGVYQALAEADLHPNWVAGISIGSINAALIAGNPPEHRVARLREFWESITASQLLGLDSPFAAFLAKGDDARSVINQASAATAMIQGVQGFFKPRILPPWFVPQGTTEAISYYDTNDLRSTLTRLVDFDRINACDIRLSVGAVNIRSGNFVYFDTRTHKIGPEHVMASGALPPGFPPVEIEGEFYWDGGLVSNTPLDWVVDQNEPVDALIFQVDLWNARGMVPRAMPEVMTRQKEIQFSSRTRASTDWIKKISKARNALASVLPQLPEEVRNSEDGQILRSLANTRVLNIVHLIYRPQNYEGYSKDYEFSRRTMEEHWQAGYHDTVRTLRHPEVLERPAPMDGVATFDLAVDGRE